MANKQVMIFGWGDGNGLTMVDAITGAKLRETSGGYTDDMVDILVSVASNRILAIDWDHNIGLYDLDMVPIVTVRLGSTVAALRSNSQQAIHIVGTSFYFMRKVGSPNNQAAADSERRLIEKYSLATGALESTIVLDATLYDAVGNATRFMGDNGHYALWTDTHIWILTATGTHANKWVKIDLATGGVVDTIAQNVSLLDPYGSTRFVHDRDGTGGLIYVSYDMTHVWKVDFVAGTSAEITLVPDNGGTLYGSPAYKPWLDLATSTWKFMNGADTHIVTLTFGATPTAEFQALGLGDLGAFEQVAFSYAGTTLGVYGLRGYSSKNLTTNTATAVFLGDRIGVAQYDYLDMESLTIADLPEFQITGDVVWNNAPVVRTVVMFDQSSHSKMSTTSSTAGTYVLPCFTSDKKYVVCEAPDGTDFKIHAHLTPEATA